MMGNTDRDLAVLGAAENVAKNVASTGPGAWSGLLGVLGRMAPNASMLLLVGSNAHNKYANADAADPQYDANTPGLFKFFEEPPSQSST